MWEFLQQRSSGRSFERLLLIKENWVFQVKEFNAFLCMGPWKSLGQSRFHKGSSTE